MKLKTLFALLFLATLAGSLTAMPPHQGLKEPEALIRARAAGRIDNPAEGLIFNQGSKYGGTAKISGSRSYPVILGRFTDSTYTYTQAQFQSMLFSNASGIKSVNNYYRDMSFNAMSCSGSVANWHSSGNTMNYFGGGNNGFNAGTTANVYDFIVKTLVHADFFVDFSLPEYDLNNDGYVDVLWAVHAGRGGEEENPNYGNWIWSHSSSLSGWGGGATYYTTKDAWIGHAGQYVKINKYIIMPEKTLYSGEGNTMIGCGVFCHEFGHAVGLPDLYDVALASNGIEGQGLGLFSLMAAGSWGGNYSSGARPVALDAWSRRYLGWLAPALVTNDNRYTVNAAMTTAAGSSYKLARLGRDTTKQYWLVENRFKNAAGTFSTVQWDLLLLGQGLLVYHIDTTYTSGTYFTTNHVNSNSTNGTSRNRPYGVALEETDMNSAGYRSELWNSSSYGEAVDVWNSGTQTSFDSSGVLYPVTYLNGTDSTTGGAHTITAIRAIPAASSAMVCSLFVGVPTGVEGGPQTGIVPQAFVLSNSYPNPARGEITFSYQLPRAGRATLEIYNMLGQTVQRFDLGYQSAGTHQQNWNAARALPGVYFFRLQAGTYSSTKKMVVVR